MLQWGWMIGLCLSWCSSYDIGCWMVSPLLMSYVEKGNSEEKGDRFRICASFQSQEGKEWEEARWMWHRFTDFFGVLLQDQVVMKETLYVWELLCAFSCCVIAWQLLHRNLFVVRDLSVSLKIIQKCMSSTQDSWNSCQYPAHARLACFSTGTVQGKREF